MEKAEGRKNFRGKQNRNYNFDRMRMWRKTGVGLKT